MRRGVDGCHEKSPNLSYLTKAVNQETDCFSGYCSLIFFFCGLYTPKSHVFNFSICRKRQQAPTNSLIWAFSKVKFLAVWRLYRDRVKYRYDRL